jgi:zinc ribbon protein
MSQMPGRSCPKCGSPITASQRFCTNCGAILEAPLQPPSQYGSQPPIQNYPQSWETPPYAQQQQVPPYMQQPQQQQSPIAEALGALGLLFLLRRYRRGYVPRRQSSGCCGCLVLLVIFLFVFGLPTFFIASHSIPNFSRYLNSSNNAGVLTTQPPITTEQINQTVPYAGVDITIVSAQRSQAFLDDNNSSTNGMLRLNLKESSTTGRGSFFYGDVARLILPDKSIVAPVNEQQLDSPGAGVTRTNWLDFPVPASIQIGQLTFQLGKNTEVQVRVPLTGKADVMQYQPKTAQLNVSTHYEGLTWTIISATVSLSDGGKQADKGMHYVMVTMKMDNPTSSDFNAYWGDYIRLQSGGTTSAPEVDSISDSFPLGIPAGSTGKTGSLTFLLPDSSTSYTLILLGRPNFNPPINQATANFQVG